MLRTEEAQKALFQYSIEGIILVNSAGEIILINPSALHMFGYNENELTGKKIEILIPEHLANKHREHRANFNAHPFPRRMGLGMELKAKRKDGREFPVEIALSPFTNNKGSFVFAFVSDITTRKEQENKLLNAHKEIKDSEEKYRDLYENSLVAMLATDLTTSHVNAVNEMGVHVFGYASKEQFVKNFKAVNHYIDPADREKNLQNLNEKGELLNVEQEMKRLDGTLFWAKISSKVNIEKNIAQTIIIDITEQKRIEQENREYTELLERSNLQLKEYSAELEQFQREMKDIAFVSSHHLQEPLRKMLMYGNILLEEEENKMSKEGKSHLEKVLNSASQMREKVSDFLLFTSLNTREAAHVSTNLQTLLHLVLTKMEALVAREKAKVEVNDPLPEIECDPLTIEKLFQNLVSNGIKFHKEKVSPVVKIYFKSIPATEMEKEKIEIYFEDNGIGIEEQHAKHLFHIFNKLSNKTEGTGIGLALCKKICHMHHGDIEVKSKVGEGSVFKVTLPVK